MEIAPLAELVDAADLGSVIERCESSSLLGGTKIWGFSSAGRAAALQAVGQRFEPVILHQN